MTKSVLWATIKDVYENVLRPAFFNALWMRVFSSTASLWAVFLPYQTIFFSWKIINMPWFNGGNNTERFKTSSKHIHQWN